jgi:hypothetical protein
MRETSKSNPRGLKSLHGNSVLEGHGFSRAVIRSELPGFSP